MNSEHQQMAERILRNATDLISVSLKEGTIGLDAAAKALIEAALAARIQLAIASLQAA